MALDLGGLTNRLRHLRCCPPPPAVSGLQAQPGGGSGEVVVVWDPLPASADVAFYRLYQRKGQGARWQVAIVDDSTLGVIVAGKVGVVDAPDYWPWPSIGVTERCYTVTAVSRRGLEGPMAAEVCSSPA